MTKPKAKLNLTSDKKIQAIVDRAAELDKQMGALKTEMESVKSELIGIADNIDERTETKTGGERVEFAAFDGTKVRVNFPGTSLVSTVDDMNEMTALRKLAGRFFPQLFRTVEIVKIKDSKTFRHDAEQFLNGDAKALIKAVSKLANPSVSFETKSQAH